MSSGHSSNIMCETHKSNFRIGFQHQNKDNMLRENFLSCDDLVNGKGENNTDMLMKYIRDIGGYFVSNKSVYLRDLLPNPNNIMDYDFIIEKDEHVFFEVITKHGNVWNKPAKYIKSKIDFHKQNNKNFDWNIDSSKRVLILVYNGADSVVIGRIFNKLCSSNNIRGTIAHISYDTISHWDLTLQIEEWRSRTVCLLGEPDNDGGSNGSIFESIFELNEYLLRNEY